MERQRAKGKGQKYGVLGFVAMLLWTAVSIHADVGRVPPQADPPKPAAAPAGNVANGGVLFKKIGCYQCHGGEGQGGLSGPRIGPNLFPLARYVQYLRKPTGDMPPYSTKVLSDQEIADIWAWVQARPRPPAVNTLPQLAP